MIFPWEDRRLVTGLPPSPDEHTMEAMPPPPVLTHVVRTGSLPATVAHSAWLRVIKPCGEPNAKPAGCLVRVGFTLLFGASVTMA